MQESQRAVPDNALARSWGLGWMLFDWGARVIGHDGGTLGQSSYFRIVPERGIAIALLTNGGNTAALYRRIFHAILGELAGSGLPPLPEPNDELAVDAARYVGTYERLASRHVIEEREGRLSLTSIDRRPLGPPAPQRSLELRPVTDSSFCFTAPESRFQTYLTFVELGADGQAGYLHLGGRTAPRVS